MNGVQKRKNRDWAIEWVREGERESLGPLLICWFNRNNQYRRNEKYEYEVEIYQLVWLWMSRRMRAHDSEKERRNKRRIPTLRQFDCNYSCYSDEPWHTIHSTANNKRRTISAIPVQLCIGHSQSLSTWTSDSNARSWPYTFTWTHSVLQTAMVLIAQSKGSLLYLSPTHSITHAHTVSSHAPKRTVRFITVTAGGFKTITHSIENCLY